MNSRIRRKRKYETGLEEDEDEGGTGGGGRRRRGSGDLTFGS